MTKDKETGRVVEQLGKLDGFRERGDWIDFLVLAGELLGQGVDIGALKDSEIESMKITLDRIATNGPDREDVDIKRLNAVAEKFGGGVEVLD